jgi:RimJ/RimL family protein N-acetyltransferase
VDGGAGASPEVLDVSDIAEHPEGVGIGARLLRTAMADIIPAGSRAPEYSRFVPPDWRDRTASRRVVQERMAAIEQTGGRFFVERLRLEWHPGTPIPEPPGRLAFRPVEEPTQLVMLMTAILDGTLDAHARADLATMSPGEAAVRQYEDELMSYESPRNWWRTAELPGGVPVGFVIPAHNGYNPIIVYIGVVPAHRGNGYVHEILAEGTRILAGQDVPRIRASTDLGNAPMAEAFRRAGWVNFGRTINMTWG